MGLCIEETPKKKRAFKTIIIPKGVIDPNEYNVIEIPLGLDKNSSLIVKAPKDSNCCFSVEPYRAALPVNVTDSDPVTPTKKPEPFVKMTSSSDKNVAPKSSHDSSVFVKKHTSPKKLDFSTQTRPLSEPVRTTPTRSSLEVPEAHSPVCPICSRASCKYGLLSPSTYYPYSFVSPRVPVCPFRVPSERLDYRYSFLSVPKSNPNETALLNKLLDEKIDKVIRPLLLSLTKASIEEEEREIGCGSSYEQFRRGLPKVSRFAEYDYDKYTYYGGRSPKADFDCNSRRKRCGDSDSDEDFEVRAKYSPRGPPTQKRTNVSFDASIEKDIDMDKIRDILNKAFIEDKERN